MSASVQDSGQIRNPQLLNAFRQQSRSLINSLQNCEIQAIRTLSLQLRTKKKEHNE